MNAYTPTDLHAEIQRRVRKETNIGLLVTDEQIFDAVNDVIEHPRHLMPSAVFLWTRVKLTNDFIAQAKALVE